MEATIFDRYGGFATVRRLVSAFYERVLDSDVIAHQFEDVEMPRLIDQQARFVSSVMGGPASYSDEHLRRIHERLGVTTEEFREMTTLLRETLEDFDFAEHDVVRGDDPDPAPRGRHRLGPGAVSEAVELETAEALRDVLRTLETGVAWPRPKTGRSSSRTRSSSSGSRRTRIATTGSTRV
jgi:hemoglobin